MGNIFKLSATLFLFTAIAAGLLSYYNGLTKPQIEELGKKNAKIARKYVLRPDTAGISFTSAKLDKEEYFVVTDENGQQLGYVFTAKGNGFSGVVETMVGTDNNFNIKGIKVLKHTETPGLGAEVKTIRYGETEPFFETWFKGRNAEKVVVYKDDANSPDKVDAITGATITTRAVCKSINKYAAKVKQSVAVNTSANNGGEE